MSMVDESEVRGDQESVPGKQYHVSFFKPGSPHSAANMKMIIAMVLIWAVGVFGFQVALLLLNEPVPEETLGRFEAVWPAVAEGAAKQEFAETLLMVLGKNVALKDPDKVVLKEGLSWAVEGLVAADERSTLDGHLRDLCDAELALSGDDAAAKKTRIREIGAAAIGLEDSGFDSLMADLLPSSLLPSAQTEFGEASRTALPEIMKKYLTHNRCFLTDFRFFGFPFHYWYTAQFLLIMFVVLCCVYALVTDRLHKRYGFVEE
ncbi:MAG: DUF4212 domain-containing protein [bacterium]|nr:DUF4212 domain-containing protein [bacterium]